MKSLFLLSFISVLATYASESAWDITQVKLNDEEFRNDFGLIERGVLGYLCCGCPGFAKNRMRKRLKEKDLLYKGSPLMQFADADLILDEFLEKNTLSLVPFKGKKVPGANNSMINTMLLKAIFCSQPSFKMALLSLLFGAAAGCTQGNFDCSWPAESEAWATRVSAVSCVLCAVPYACSVVDSALIHHGSKIGSDALKEN